MTENYLVMQDHPTCEVEEKQGEEVKEEFIDNKVSFLDAPQGLETARKYIQQLNVEDNILMMCSTLENKLYTLKRQEKCKQITIMDQLKNKISCFEFANDCYFTKFILNS